MHCSVNGGCQLDSPSGMRHARIRDSSSGLAAPPRPPCRPQGSKPQEETGTGADAPEEIPASAAPPPLGPPDSWGAAHHPPRSGPQAARQPAPALSSGTFSVHTRPFLGSQVLSFLLPDPSRQLRLIS